MGQRWRKGTTILCPESFLLEILVIWSLLRILTFGEVEEMYPFLLRREIEPSELVTSLFTLSISQHNKHHGEFIRYLCVTLMRKEYSAWARIFQRSLFGLHRSFVPDEYEIVQGEDKDFIFCFDVDLEAQVTFKYMVDPSTGSVTRFHKVSSSLSPEPFRSEHWRI